MEDSVKSDEWSIRLFRKSILKQNKLRLIINFLGDTKNLHCLDIGSDNGVISYFLRKRDGFWKSADLDPAAVKAIEKVVHTDVCQIQGDKTPFQDQEFDRVVIVDFLEHIPDDRAFIKELYRILKPSGEVIINVPHIKKSFLRKFRLSIGQTDEKHGHLRPGYTEEGLRHILGPEFSVLRAETYSRFFLEVIDTLVTFFVGLLKKGDRTQKGMIFEENDFQKNQRMFRMYSFVYPVFWLFSKLDYLLFWRSGYMLMAKAKVNKH